MEERLANETRANNGGRIICVYCSRATKSTGRANPNCRYEGLDDRLFEHIDSEAKAYLLGWVASDGSIRKNTIHVFVDRKDEPTLRELRDIACAALPIKTKKPNLVGFSINSAQIAQDACRLLEIEPGKKSNTVGFPKLQSDELQWAFVRGVFDGDGCVGSVAAALRRAGTGWPAPRCSITTNSARLRQGIMNFVQIPAHEGRDQLQWYGTNALDFLGKLYTGASISLARKRNLYEDWCCWVPALNAGQDRRGATPLFRWAKTHPAAVPPSKQRVSDSGFDLHLIAKERTVGAVEFYRTGIKIQPAFGWYFDLVPRSSISKTGYMLANGVGVIDRAYTGEILVPLIKLDKDAAELTLPCRLVQIIPRPIIAAEIVEVDELDATSRGDGGFGSSDRR